MATAQGLDRLLRVVSSLPGSARIRAEASGLDLARIAFSVAVAAVAAVQGVLFYIGFTETSVEVDEGYFLDVVHNLGTGHGYVATGNYGGTSNEPFSTGISTGPTLLVPAAGLHALGIEPLLAGRLAATPFYLALLVAMWFIGWRIGGRWGGLAATLGPVLLNTFTFDQSPIYAPQVVLGEYTAAALVAWALVTARRRPGVAGVLFGFAVLAKVVVAFLLPAVLLAIILARLVVPRRSLARDLLRFTAGALVPVMAFEAVKLVVLGWSAYLQLVHTYWGATQVPRLTEYMVDEKTSALWQSWFLPTPVVLALAALALALVSGVVATRMQVWKAAGLSWRAIASDERFVMAASGLTAGMGILLGWAALKNTDPQWIRHPAPGLVIAAGVGAAILVATGTALVRWGGSGRRLGAAVLVVLMLVLTVVPLRHVDAALREPRFGYLSTQRGLAEIIDESGTAQVQGIWGPMVPLALLADKPAHSILYDVNAQDLLVIDIYPRGHLAVLGHQLADSLCGKQIYHSGSVILCWPTPDIASKLATLLAEDVATPEKS
ncbi:hypothetical protein [Demequina lutea]|uniref:Dolichyl-phosphate-mannose-protein mannosyltransferase n=1 Tax=Demequina lutea TaxID=431489 RepID=A0A7Y9Z9Q9_9MICO|nr:hypothetical protein [Demequina lutea]NYI40120.1 hypothetical protein [Demequina lutea]